MPFSLCVGVHVQTSAVPEMRTVAIDLLTPSLLQQIESRSLSSD